MGLIHEDKTYALKIRESATDGSDFSNPAADYRMLFLGEDGQLHVKDSAGTVTDIGASSGAVATDVIWDAAGDLVQGTGANTAAKLTAGTAGMFLKSAGAAAANLWAFPPGYELDYVQITSPVTINATSEGAANTCITGSSVAYNGSTIVMIEVFCPRLEPGSGGTVVVDLYEDSSILGRLAVFSAGTTASSQLNASKRHTPSNASHTYTVKAWRAAADGTFTVGAGGTGAYLPGFIRITKV